MGQNQSEILNIGENDRLAEQGRAGHIRAGHVREGHVRAGHAMAGHYRAGKGRAGQGRAGPYIAYIDIIFYFKSKGCIDNCFKFWVIVILGFA